MKQYLLATTVFGMLLAAGPILGGDDDGARDKAIDRIKRLGGKYFADPNGRAVVVYLESTRLENADLALLKDLPETTQLDLTTTAIADAGLKHLSGLTRLTHLDVSNTAKNDPDEGKTRITDAGLETLKDLTKLRFLHLSRTDVTDAALKFLTGLPELEELDLYGTRVTDAGAKELEKALPKVRIQR